MGRSAEDFTPGVEGGGWTSWLTLAILLEFFVPMFTLFARGVWVTILG